MSLKTGHSICEGTRRLVKLTVITDGQSSEKCMNVSGIYNGTSCQYANLVLASAGWSGAGPPPPPPGAPWGLPPALGGPPYPPPWSLPPGHPCSPMGPIPMGYQLAKVGIFVKCSFSIVNLVRRKLGKRMVYLSMYLSIYLSNYPFIY